MEDYSSACIARYLDVDALIASEPPRSTAAVHIGGIAVECQIKAQILVYHRISKWTQLGQRPKESYYGRPVDRPGHHLLSAVKVMGRVYERARADPLFIKHLDRLMHPVGSRNADFIDLRYAGSDIAQNSLDDWRQSLKYVDGWLRKNEALAK